MLNYTMYPWQNYLYFGISPFSWRQILGDMAFLSFRVAFILPN